MYAVWGLAKSESGICEIFHKLRSKHFSRPALDNRTLYVSA